MQLSVEETTRDGLEEITKMDEELERNAYQGIWESLLDEILYDIQEALKEGAMNKNSEDKTCKKVCMMKKKEIYELID